MRLRPTHTLESHFSVSLFEIVGREHSLGSPGKVGQVFLQCNFNHFFMFDSFDFSVDV